jgi:2-methylisocitrate lyase-like PEP mutase family enzyme
VGRRQRQGVGGTRLRGLATTSSGFAFTLGRPDGQATLEEVIEHFDPDRGLYEIAEATERVAAAAEASARLDFPFLFTARAENQIRGNPDLDDTIARLRAYEQAGADVLYAPGLRDAAEIRAVCEAVSLPVNVLARPGLTMAEIVAAGAQRVSVGGSLAWTSIEAMAASAEAMRDQGDLSTLAGASRIREWLGG